MPQTYDYWDGQTPNMFQQDSQQAVDDLNERFERLQQAMSAGAKPSQNSQASSAESQFMSQISQENATQASAVQANATPVPQPSQSSLTPQISQASVPEFAGANAAGVPVYEIGSKLEPTPQPAAKAEPAPVPAPEFTLEPGPGPAPMSTAKAQPASQPQSAAQPTPQPAAQSAAAPKPAPELASQPAPAAQAAPAPQPMPQPAPTPAPQQQQQPQPAPAPAQQKQQRKQQQPQPAPAPQPQPAYAAAPQPAYAAAPAGAAPQPIPQQVIYQMPPQKKSRAWIVALVLVVGLLALAFFGVKSCSDAIGSTGHYSIGTGPTSDSIAVLTMDGTIQYDGTACSPEGFKSLLDEAANDSHIKAIVLRVNSGGGVAAAGEEMAAYLRDFDKPVVVSSAAINASAAYEISSQGDWIMVLKSSEVGSIGTAMELTDISGLLDMLGINMEVITSADSKDSSYGYRQLSAEERAYYQHMVTQINEMFIQNVADGRKMDIEKVRELANGLAYTGVDAIENGLADEYGTMEDAIDKAAQLAGLSSYEVYDLSLTTYDWASLYDMLGSTGGEQQKLIPLLNELLGQQSK